MPALVLILFITAEALLKGHTKSTFHPFSVGPLIVCLAYFFYYFRKTSQGAGVWESFISPAPPSKWNSLIVAGIILTGCFFRFWNLETLFEGMTYDEAYKGLDAIAIREFGERPVFLDWNGGREALVAYLVAAAQTVFDTSSIAVRVVTAIAGSASLLFFYLFVRTVFNNHIALLSTFLLAVSKWHIIHSRYGVRAGLYPVFELATLYFVARALTSDRRRTGSLIAAGVFGGLGLYTYIAYRVFPFVLPAFLAEKNIRKNLSPYLKPILAATIVSLAVVVPLARFYIENPESLTGRMKRTSVWSQKGKEQESPVRLVLESSARTFGMFTYSGDPIARHNVNAEPMLSPFTTSFFILGAFLTLIHARKPYATFLLIYFFITILPGILSVGAPNVPRVFGCLPVAILFTSFGIYGAAQIVSRFGSTSGRTFIAIVLSGSMMTGALDAMVRYPEILDSLSTKVAAIWGADRDQTNVARLSNQLGESCEVYLSPQFFFHSTIEYLTYSKSNHKLITPGMDFRKESSRDKVVVVFLQQNVINPWWLRDDDGKGFYKWWHQVYGMEIRDIRTIVRKTYDPPFTRTSDWRVLNMLKNKYPQGKEIRFEHFSAFVFKTSP